MYYLESRYYDSGLRRFISSDRQLNPGLLGHNLFAYCLNNPINYIDNCGTSAEALQLWTVGMGWLPAIDLFLPLGDAIYVGGLLLFGSMVITDNQDSTLEIVYDEPEIVHDSPTPDSYDDYSAYDDFNNRQKIGKSKGKTPGNNKKQNKQFKAATRGLTKKQKRAVHDKITKEGLGYQEIKNIAKDLFNLVIGILFINEDN